MGRFLSNENMPDQVVAGLRAAGHDVLSVKDIQRGLDDARVLALAQEQHRVLLTLDKDFSQLAFRAGLPSSSGVVLFRLDWVDPAADHRRMLAAMALPIPWEAHMTVVESDRVRSRPLPPPKPQQ